MASFPASFRPPSSFSNRPVDPEAIQQFRQDQIAGVPSSAAVKQAVNNARAQFRQISRLEQQFPGRAEGGTGLTGLTQGDKFGFSDVLEARQAKESILSAFGVEGPRVPSVTGIQLSDPNLPVARRERIRARTASRF